MRRKDREVTDFNEIIRIISLCDVLHLGMCDERTPYVVPVNFGYSAHDKSLIFYIHSAISGKKIEILKKNPQVFLQLDCNHQLISGSQEKPCAFSFAYACVMAQGIAEFIEDLNEKSAALNLIIKHTAKTEEKFNFPEPMLKKTCVLKIKAAQVSAKEHKI